MTSLVSWFKRTPPDLGSIPPTRPGADPEVDKVRRGLFALAVRDTLQKHGIPHHWITAETHSALTAGRIRGMHLRLVVREWRPDLLPYSIALQRAILARLMRLDPLSPGWVAGVSWRYDVLDDSTCPALPRAAHWSEAGQEHALAPSLLDVAPSNDAEAGVTPVPDFRPTVPMTFSPG